MKAGLKRAASRLPLLWSLFAKRSVLQVRLHALLRTLIGRSARGRLEDLRRDIAPLLRISPVFVAHDRQGFMEAARGARLADASKADRDPLGVPLEGRFRLRRFCLCCNETTSMLVDCGYDRAQAGASGLPNWRELLVCSHCGMNNRQRLMAKLVQQFAMERRHCTVYLMEQVTPLFEWVRNLHGVEVHGSEYLGDGHKGGDRVHGVRNEDVMNLSWPDESFDLIVSNDVLEHIPDPEKAFKECFRVLKLGGTVLATFPFHTGNEATIVRAKLAGNTIDHLHPPQYHGNPLSSEGSLVFQDFGWDLLGVMRSDGFSSAACEMYASDKFGHLGAGLLVFRLSKP